MVLEVVLTRGEHHLGTEHAVQRHRRGFWLAQGTAEHDNPRHAPAGFPAERDVHVSVPDDPLIFHITHVDNLAGIVREGGVWSDAQREERKLSSVNIGYRHIKARRRDRVVPVAAGGTLGQYVPFNFCHRSVMLYVIHVGHDDYEGGQDEVVHLVSRAKAAIATGRPWAFTDRHADLAHALFHDDLAHLGDVRWQVMEQEYWQGVKEERQAEFLVHEFFPWTAILGIGVRSASVAERVEAILAGQEHQPKVVVRPGWYY